MDFKGLTLCLLGLLVCGAYCQPPTEDCCMNELCPYYCVRCDGTSQCFDLSDELGCSTEGDKQLQAYSKPPIFVPFVLKTLKAQIRREKESVASVYTHRQCLPRPTTTPIPPQREAYQVNNNNKGHEPTWSLLMRKLKGVPTTRSPPTTNNDEPVWLQLLNKLKAEKQSATTTTRMASTTTFEPPWYDLLIDLIQEVKRNTTTTAASVMTEAPTTIPPSTTRKPISSTVSIAPSTVRGVVTFDTIVDRTIQIESKPDATTELYLLPTTSTVESVTDINGQQAANAIKTTPTSTAKTLISSERKSTQIPRFTTFGLSGDVTTDQQDLAKEIIVQEIIETIENITDTTQLFQRPTADTPVVSSLNMSTLESFNMTSPHNTTDVTTETLNLNNSTTQTLEPIDVSTEAVTGVPIKLGNITTDQIMNIDKLYEAENQTSIAPEGIAIQMITTSQSEMFNYIANSTTYQTNSTEPGTTTPISNTIVHGTQSQTTPTGTTIHDDNNSNAPLQSSNETIIYNTSSPEEIIYSNSTFNITTPSDESKTISSTSAVPVTVQKNTFQTNISVGSIIHNKDNIVSNSSSLVNSSTKGNENSTIPADVFETETPSSISDISSTESEINLLLTNLRLKLNKTKERMAIRVDQQTDMGNSTRNYLNGNDTKSNDTQIDMVKYGLLSDVDTRVKTSTLSTNDSTGNVTIHHVHNGSNSNNVTASKTVNQPPPSWVPKPTTFPFDNFLDTITSLSPLVDSEFRPIPSKTIWSLDSGFPMSRNLENGLVGSSVTVLQIKSNSHETNIGNNTRSTAEDATRANTTPPYIDNVDPRINTSNQDTYSDMNTTILPVTSGVHLRNSTISGVDLYKSTVASVRLPGSNTNLRDLSSTNDILPPTRPATTETTTQSEVDILLKEVRKTLTESKSRIAHIADRLASMNVSNDLNSTYQITETTEPTRKSLFKYGLLTDFQADKDINNFTVNRSVGVRPILQETSKNNPVKEAIHVQQTERVNQAPVTVTPLPWMFQTTAFPFDSIWNPISTPPSLLDSVWNPMPPNTLWGSLFDNNWNIGPIGMSTTSKAQAFFQPVTAAPAPPPTTPKPIETTTDSFMVTIPNKDTLMNINAPVKVLATETARSFEQPGSVTTNVTDINTVKQYTVLEAETQPVLASKASMPGELIPIVNPTYSATVSFDNSLNNNAFTTASKSDNSLYDTVLAKFESKNDNPITTVARDKLYSAINSDNGIHKSTTMHPEFASIIIQIENELVTLKRQNDLQGSTGAMITPDLHSTQSGVEQTSDSTSATFTQTASRNFHPSTKSSSSSTVVSNNTTSRLYNASIKLIKDDAVMTTDATTFDQMFSTTSYENHYAKPIGTNSIVTVTKTSPIEIAKAINHATITNFPKTFTTTSKENFNAKSTGTSSKAKVTKTSPVDITKSIKQATLNTFDQTFTTTSNKNHNSKPTNTNPISTTTTTSPVDITHSMYQDTIKSFNQNTVKHAKQDGLKSPVTTNGQKQDWWNRDFRPTTWFPFGSQSPTTTVEPWNIVNKKLTSTVDATPTTTVSSVAGCVLVQDASAFCKDLYSGQYKNPNDCTTYFVCDWGDLHRCRCPPNTLFDSKLRVCNWDYAVTC